MSPTIITIITLEVCLTAYSLKKSGVLAHAKKDISNLAKKTKDGINNYTQSIKDNYQEGLTA